MRSPRVLVSLTLTSGLLHCGGSPGVDTEGGTSGTGGTTDSSPSTPGSEADSDPPTGGPSSTPGETGVPTGGVTDVTLTDGTVTDDSGNTEDTGDTGDTEDTETTGEPVVVCSPEPTGPAFYVDATLGLDSNDGLTPETAWQSVARVNAAQGEGLIVPGVFVLFKRGETFAGTLQINSSGVDGQPITFGSYDCGDKPVISGFVTASAWAEVSPGVWETECATCGSDLNLVVMDGEVQAMGRYPNRDAPNEGYLTIDSHVGNAGDPDPWSLQDAELAAAPISDWTGGQAIIAKNYYVIDRCPIVGQQGTTLFYNQDQPHSPNDGFGYFIQDHPGTLDKLGEWYFEPGTKKVRMFFGAEGPATHTVQIAALGDVVIDNQQKFFVLETLSLQGANYFGLNLSFGSDIVLRETDAIFSGEAGLNVESSPRVTIEGALVSDIANNGINVHDSSDVSITGSTVRDVGLIPGHGIGNSGNYSGIAITNYGNVNKNIVVEGNHVYNTGYMGIYFASPSVLVKNNVVENFGLVKSDGGGIYTWAGATHTDRKIVGNIVHDGYGPLGSLNSPVRTGVSCIYLDDQSANVEIVGNSLTGCSRSGIFVHNSHEVTVTDNVVFDLPVQFELSHQSNEPEHPIRNIRSSGNVFFAKHPDQRIIASDSISDDFSQFNVADAYDGNVYARPLHDDGYIATAYEAAPNFYLTSYYGMSTWRQDFGVDKTSKGSPVLLAPYKIESMTGGDLVKNGAFKSDASGMFCQSVPAGCVSGWTANGPITGPAAQVTYDPMNGPNESMRLYVSIGSVKAGKSYVVRFAMKTDGSDRTFSARAIEDGGMFGALTEPRFFTLGKTTTHAELVVPASGSVNALLVIDMQRQQAPLWIDDVTMFEADVTVTDPDDFIRYEVNATDKPKDVALDGKYIDAHGAAHENTITLAPFSSTVLMKPMP